MKRPRDLSGRRLADCLCRDWNYRLVHQVGSHIILETLIPERQRMVVPDHRALRIGTLSAILRAVAEHKSVPRQRLLDSL